jgi:FdhD protein
MSTLGYKQAQVVRRSGLNDLSPETDLVASETAIAMVYNGVSHVVMMATPYDLEEFALGFSLTERIIDTPSQLYGIEIQTHALGIELEITIANECFARLKEKRRNLTGRTGCGLCGADSLRSAIPDLPPVKPHSLPSREAIERALKTLNQHQPLQALTGAVHGAALCNAAGKILLLKEDIGRHNALDKLIGSLPNINNRDLTEEFILISSRASFEMINKCVMANIGNLVAVSAPTLLAIHSAKVGGVNLIGFAREGKHVIYTQHENKIQNPE